MTKHKYYKNNILKQLDTQIESNKTKKEAT